MKETDLYFPLKEYLEKQNYVVKGEINHCDVVACRGEEEPVIVELKLNLNLSVLLQAVERNSLSSKVYVGVPATTSILKKQRKRILKLFRLLGMGLILIEPKRKIGAVDILLDPGDYQPRRNKKKTERLLGEFEKRSGDPNPGGSDRRKGLLTAYRQRSLAIAEYLEENGPTKASIMAKILEESKARDIVYNNVYGWFEKTGHGVYGLSPRGKTEIPDWVQRNKIKNAGLL